MTQVVNICWQNQLLYKFLNLWSFCFGSIELIKVPSVSRCITVRPQLIVLALFLPSFGKVGVIFALFIKVALLDIFLGFLEGTLPKTWLACCQRVIVFKFCPWFSLCSYGILCNLCTPWLSLSQRYWLILDQYIGRLSVAISVNISADSWSISWLTLAVRLLVDMLAYRSSDSQLRVGWCVDQQIGRLCWSLCWPIVRRHINQ